MNRKRPSKHYRVIKTKKGRKRVLVNPKIKKPKIKRKMGFRYIMLVNNNTGKILRQDVALEKDIPKILEERNKSVKNKDELSWRVKDYGV